MTMSFFSCKILIFIGILLEQDMLHLAFIMQ